MTRPELRRCAVRGPSMSGIAGSPSLVGLDCFVRLQLVGILHRQATVPEYWC